ncbi:bacteriohemerythrin [Anaeromyxobacter paludicola]|uniref:Hemerythrin n=1 Tax=Anaeromyxobacter paludicola TaxID=2918171 RepID=A0ABM7XB54_9BACT|nr:bacteriohemerythrin [Anaeromyxobacter paludicola]BDG09081.1 hemerythrin [Anaeromyxobacter paludicola]
MPQWTPALAVGVKIIDEQHQELFRRLDALLAAMAKGDRAEVGRLLGFLASYAIEHFGEEERLMKAHGYPEYAVHKVAHDRFVAEYTAMKAEFDTKGATSLVTLKVNKWLGDWLKTHIAGTDTLLGRFLIQKAG